MKTQNNRTTRAVAFLVIATFLIMAVFPVALAAAPDKAPKNPLQKTLLS